MKKLIQSLIFLVGIQFNGYSQNFHDTIDQYISSYAETNDFSGRVLIIRNDSTLFHKGYGYAKYGLKTPNSKNTRFMIGSISKQFTAAALLLLEQDGILTLSDTLGIYFPDKEKVSHISLIHLLTHQSGIPDIYDIPGIISDEEKKLSDITSILMDQKLYFEPGTRYQYSNGAYSILAHIIEITSGKSYKQFLKERIFLPLNMMDTGHETDFSDDMVATGYDPSGYNNLEIAEITNIEPFLGSGSISSTTADLYQWINVLNSDQLLNEANRAKFFKNYGNSYGLGISVYKMLDQRVYGHDGRITGFIADYLHYPELNMSIIILGNIQTGIVDFLRRDIAAIILGKPYESKAKSAQPAQLKDQELKALIGTYEFGPNFNVYLKLIDGKPMVKANEGSFSEIVPLAVGRFFNRTLYSYIRFSKSETGLTTSMVWINNDGNQFTGTKTN